MSVAGVPIDEFSGVAEEFATSFEADYLDGKRIDPYAIYGAQAAQVMLDAIGESEDDLFDVLAKMFATEVTDGLLGSFKFNENGDPEDASAPGWGFYDLRRDRQARDGEGDLAESGGRRGGRWGVRAPRGAGERGGRASPAA